MTQEALKLALDALENHTAIKHPQQIHYRDKAITAIKEALAQTQEPVADAYALADKVREALDRKACPDAFMRIAYESIIKNYTTPPQRTWVGLTAEEQRNIAYSDINCWDWGELMDATEAKLKEKNT